MKTLCTGGAGFIGSHLVDLLIKEGHEVITIDNFSTGKKENLNKKAVFCQGDIRDKSLVSSLCKGIDWIFHIAALPRVVRSVEDPIETNSVNVGGTITVLQAAREANVKKVVYASSSSVYGDQPSHLMNENMTPKPKSPYALQKLIGEQYCALFSKLFKMKIISLRYFNVYGSRQLTEGAYALVIGKFIKQKKEGKSMTIYGDGEQTRAYTHVSDVAKATLLGATTDLLNEEGGYHYAINIGTSTEVSVNKIVKLIGGKFIHIIPNPRGEFEERRKAADNSLAEVLLDWKPTIEIEEGIKTVL